MSRIKKAFERAVVTLPIQNIRPQKELAYDQRRVLYYKQVAASIDEVGLIEPLVVHLEKPGEFLLLDGHVRLDVLKRKGAKEVPCILSTDDEAYTYNRRVNTITPVAQHVMLLKALENGLSEERIATSLRVDIASIRRKRNLLDGVCDEAIELLKNQKVSAKAFALLKKMKPIRQIEAAEHMVANLVFSGSFVQAILYATKSDLLVNPPKSQKKQGLSDTTKNLFAHESNALLRDLKNLESDLGKEALTLTVFSGYVKRLLANPRVKRYLERKHQDLLSVLENGASEGVH